VLDGDAAEPRAEEAADLVHEHGRAQQGRQSLDPETARQQAGGRRQRRRVGDTDGQCEADQHAAAGRKPKEGEDRRDTQGVDDRQQRRARETLHDEADADAARDVGEAGEHKPQAGERRRKATALDHARHVHCQEGDVEAAHPEAACDQPEACVAQRCAAGRKAVRRRRTGGASPERAREG